MITIFFIALVSLAVPFLVPNLLHDESELNQFKNNKERFKHFYWKDSLRLFSLATVAYLVLAVSLLRHTNEQNTHKATILAIVLIMFWSIGNIYAHTKK